MNTLIFYFMVHSFAYELKWEFFNPKTSSYVARFIFAFICLNSYGPQTAKNKNAI